ncbi:hypothetical protein B5F71_17710, partial [Bacteroides sp. An269]
RRTGAKRTKKSPKAHTKTDTSSQEKLFGEIQNSFLVTGNLIPAGKGVSGSTQKIVTFACKSPG